MSWVLPLGLNGGGELYAMKTMSVNDINFLKVTHRNVHI